ncbi:hypothetical protein [Marmoricola sp. URHB0036]|nr:hypothetical protein [Marmoricola sp. URHB0036]
MSERLCETEHLTDIQTEVLGAVRQLVEKEIISNSSRRMRCPVWLN